jgi:hypothetical protein
MNMALTEHEHVKSPYMGCAPYSEEADFFLLPFNMEI